MIETPMERLVDDLSNCSNISIKYDIDKFEWKAEFEYDHCGFTGRGDSPEEALIEAVVDKEIADFYYCGSMDGPGLTQDEMNTRLRDKYRHYLNKHPDHEYRGNYIAKEADPQNPRQVANRCIVERLQNAVELYPDMRFWQLLMNLDVLDYRMIDGIFHCKDPWNEESRTTLNRMKVKS